MVRMSPQAFSCLYGKDVIAYGTGITGKRMIPYLAQDPSIKLRGVTNSRITSEDDGAFLDTGLPIRNIKTWAKLFPNAVVLITAGRGIEEITSTCNAVGLYDIQLVTAEMMKALIKMEDQIAESQTGRYLAHMCLANEIHDTHKAAFSEFKGCNRGKTVVIIATGPSMNYYTPIARVSHIGVNSSFLNENVPLDFYFLLHNVPEWLDKLKNCHFVKFFGVNTNSNSWDQIPEYIIEENGGRQFFTTDSIPGTKIHTNLEYYPLMFYGSIVFPAIHFALYTHPKKLLLVGCDCAFSGHYDGTEFPSYTDKIQIPQWIDGYKEVKRFVDIHYPDTEIISINPVGLKGMFHDVYTESYLETHPKLDPRTCKVLNPQDI